MSKYIILIFLICIGLISCDNKPKEYKYSIAYVYKSKPVHWGFGYYKLLVYYEFEYNNKKYRGKYEYNKLAHIYSKKYNEGDSVLIRFPKDNIMNSQIVKLKYIKSRNYRVN